MTMNLKLHIDDRPAWSARLASGGRGPLWREVGMAAVGTAVCAAWTIASLKLARSYSSNLMALAFVAPLAAGFAFRSVWGMLWWPFGAAISGAIIGLALEGFSPREAAAGAAAALFIMFALALPMVVSGLVGVWLGRRVLERGIPREQTETPTAVAAAPVAPPAPPATTTKDRGPGRRAELATSGVGLMIAVVACLFFFHGETFIPRSHALTFASALRALQAAACLAAIFAGLRFGSVRGMLWWPLIAAVIGGVWGAAADADHQIHPWIWIYGWFAFSLALPPTILGLLSARAGNDRRRSRPFKRHDEADAQSAG